VKYTGKEVEIEGTYGRKEKVNVYHRLGLVELGSELSSVQEKLETVVIGNNSPTEQNAFIEIPSK